MNTPLIIQRPKPAAAGVNTSNPLVLLMHGVGATADDLEPLGRLLAQAMPQAWVISLPGNQPTGYGDGREWFSLQGITEANRSQRVQSALPPVLEAIAACQTQSGLGPAHTVLVGFSQGAIMALEATAMASTSGSSLPAHRVVSVAGRFAQLPTTAPHPDLHIHWVHGDSDAVMPVQHAQSGAARLTALGASCTLDIVPHLGHGINAMAAGLIVQRVMGSETF